MDERREVADATETAQRTISESARKERSDRDRFNVVATRFSTELGAKFERKFDEKTVAFDLQAFKVRFEAATGRVFLDPNVPDIAKEKFKEDLLAKIDLLASVELADIDALRTRRGIESFGVEPMELDAKYGKDEAKKRGFYLGKILESTLGRYVEPATAGLAAGFSDAKRQMGGSEYHAKTMDAFQGGMRSLDSQFGIDVASRIEAAANGSKGEPLSDLARRDLFREVGLSIVDQYAAAQKIPQAGRIRELIRNGVLNEHAKMGKQTEVMTPSGPKDLVDVILAYKEPIRTFQMTERDVRAAKGQALATGPVAAVKRELGMEQLKSEFDRFKPENIESKLANASLSDMVIVVGQLARVVPVAGDAAAGLDGLVNSYSGTDVNGTRLTALDRSFGWMFGVLGITVAGGFAGRAYRAGKLESILSSFGAIRKHFPQKLEAFVQLGNRFPEQARLGIATLARFIGGETAVRIQNALAKQATGPGIAPVVDAAVPDASPSVPRRVVASPREALSQAERLANLRKAERAAETAANSWEKLPALMRLDIAKDAAYPGSVSPMRLQMAKEAIKRWDRAHELMKTDPIAGKAMMGEVRMTFEKTWAQEAYREHSAKTVADRAIDKAKGGSLKAAKEAA